MNPFEKLVNMVELIEVPHDGMDGSELPYVTHRGVVRIGDIEIDVRQLNTGQRVITEESLAKLFNSTVEEFREAMRQLSNGEVWR